MMSYERNSKCRFLEISIYGYKSIIMENSKIRTMFILDKGCEIVELNHKATDTDFVWRTPQGLENLKNARYLPANAQEATDTYTGGWFECFPNVGDACNYKGAFNPQYGEARFLSFEYTVVKNSAEEVSIKCFAKTIKTPYYIEKTFTIRSDDPTLYVEECIKNLCSEDLNYQWGHHPNFGENIIDEYCTIDVPAGNIQAHKVPYGSIFEAGTCGNWPFMDDVNGNQVNLSKLKSKDSNFVAIIDVQNLSDGYATIYNEKKKIGIKLSWDPDMYKHLVIWYAFGGDSGYPRYGDTYVLGLVFHNDRQWGLDKITDSKASPLIKSGEIIKTWFKATVI